jgi:hypothetical protein
MAPNNKRASDSPQPLPKKPRKPSGLPPISWTADLTWRLLGEIEKGEDYKILFGKRSKHEVIFSRLPGLITRMSC